MSSQLEQRFANLSAWKQEELFNMLTVRWWITRIGIGLLMIIPLMMYGCPQYNVWSSNLKGRAELVRAEQNRQIAIEEARATEESAQYLSAAEVLRAEGVAEANKIIADGLGGPEGYLRYLYIEGLKEAENEGASIIYIPTEAGLPILEAQRRTENGARSD